MSFLWITAVCLLVCKVHYEEQKPRKKTLYAFTWLASKTDSDTLTAQGLHPNTHATIPFSI